MSITKILFLDVDGVLNHQLMWDRKKGPWQLHRPSVGLMLEFVREHDVKIVLSSTWRKHRSGIRKLYKAGFRWVGITPTISTCRGDEIQSWLDHYPHKVHYAIIDDDGDMLPHQEPYFVQTIWLTGLQEEHIQKLIEVYEFSSHENKHQF